MTQDQGLFGPDSVTWRVHLEPVMWAGGFRALLLQSLHPRVMRGTYQNSALFDPKKAWARFQRTVEYVGVRTFGSTADVERVASRVRKLHASLRGFDPDTGHTFRLDDPSHLLWVHATEIDSYAEIARRAGLLNDGRGGALPGRERPGRAGDRAGRRAVVPRGDGRRTSRASGRSWR